MKWRAYPAYRDSGVEWLGETPEHWPVTRLKRIVSICNGQDYKEFEAEDGAYPVIGSGGEFARARVALFNGESVLLGRKGTIDKPLYIDGPFWVVDTMFYTKIYPQAFPKFVYYSALTIPFEMYSTNTALPSMTGENLSFHVTTAPDYTEQKAIASFLDRETSRLDELIAKKQRQIELLHEKRSALISHVVTKGLDPDVKMKDSGVEWLGEIPEHWALMRLKFVVPAITVGIVITPTKHYVDEGVPCLRSLNVREDGIVQSDLVYISPESNELLRKSKLEKGDVVVVRTGQPGTTAVVDERFDGANCIDLIIIRKSDKYDSRYLCYVMNSSLSKTQYFVGTSGAIQAHFNVETAGNMLVALPPYDEQIEIRQLLDREVLRIDGMINKVEESNRLLREYRTALISTAVTGKIDVREETHT